MTRGCNATRGLGVCGRKARRKVPGYQQYRCAECYKYMLSGAMRRMTMARRHLDALLEAKKL